MIDKPALGNAYERMKEYEDRNRQENLASQMRPEFRNAIINSTTKNYKAVPIQKLAEWNAMLSGSALLSGRLIVGTEQRYTCALDGETGQRHTCAFDG
ncbi:MAG: hypothetical protein IJI14_06600 [Anaerolineaceae bacterium]|nr:hypothetical protein [Anaerolineaceae bacterium]